MSAAAGAGPAPGPGRRAVARTSCAVGVPTGSAPRPDGGATRIVLVRHGEAVCNVNGIVGGVRGCTGLTELGRRQVSALAARLERDRRAGRGDRALRLGPAPGGRDGRDPAAGGGRRARSTSSQECDLCELHPGEADGLGWQEVVDRFGVPEWDTDPDTADRPGR